MPAIVTLTTDFGLADGYVGAVKGAILSIDPGAILVDITHTVPPQDVFQGAFALATACGAFPAGTVHVAVVDPGVGGSRRCIAATNGSHLFVGPDNGVLSLALCAGAEPGAEGSDPLVALEQPVPGGCVVVDLAEPRFHRPFVSPTFHGRDIFGPVAGHLSRGVPIEQLGLRVQSIRRFAASEPLVYPDGSVRGAILHVDRFGNAITNIRREHLTSQDVEVLAGGTTIRGLSRTYAAGQDVVALWGSSETLEIAITGGNAARELGLRRGGTVVARPVVR